MTGPRLSRARTRALDSILELAEADPEGVVSVRAFAARLGCTTSTAWAHREWLVRAGYLRLVDRRPGEAPSVRATRQRRPDVTFGTCPVCGVERPLGQQGLLPRHDGGRQDRRTCPGSRRTPRAVA